MTNTALAERQEDAGAIMESVIVKGDLSKLTPAERSQYYAAVCKSVGLNPLTKPFEFITLNGKLTLYALRTCTDQLRAIHKVSVVDLTETERDGVFIVTAKMQNGDGRTDMAKGAVTIGNLKGDALANALMKAETKAKRRATLSICGLGFLDETEVETIPNGNGPKSSAQAKRDGDWEMFAGELIDCTSVKMLARLHDEYRDAVYPKWKPAWVEAAEEAFEKRQAELTANDLEGTLRDSIDEETGEVLEPQPATRAEYIQDCHERIAESDDASGLLEWWNARETKAERRRFSLTNAEIKDLMERVVTKRAELEPMAAG